MAKQGDLLQQGPCAAPEPDTAEARKKRVGSRALAGGAVVPRAGRGG